MRTSDGRTGKRIRLKTPKTRAGKVAVLLLVNMAVMLLSVYLLRQPSILKAELKEIQGRENYDTIIVGDSHGETAFDPEVLDKKLGTKSYNCARRIMPVKDIYYLMREVSWHNDPKTIIYEIDPFYWSSPGVSLGNDTSIFFEGSDPENRLDYFVDEMLHQPFTNLLADYRFAPRNAAQILGTAWVRLQPEYWKHSEKSIPMIMHALFLGQDYEYRGRGFRYGLQHSASQNMKFGFSVFKAKKAAKENVAYFHKMAEFCRTRGIRLVCVYSALPPYRLQNENEDDAHAYFSRLCEKEGVEYYDLNYLKPDLLPRTDYDYVDLDGHMMGKLAERQTGVLADLLTADDPGSMFVDSYDEVKAGLPEFAGIPGIDEDPYETGSETETES